MPSSVHLFDKSDWGQITAAFLYDHDLYNNAVEYTNDRK